MKKLLILGIAALALTACTDTKVPFLSSKSGNTNSSSNASGTSVGLFANLKEQLNGREFIIVTEGYNSKTSIGFKGDRVYGFSGINRYFGTYQVSGGKFIFSEFGLTRMAGSEKEMTQELKFLDILKNNKSVKLSGDTLTLISTEGIELIFKDPKAAVTQSK
ncbi:MAG: META domain-containing protein [Fusobacterium sp.]|uniref:META domain-containing protein n=1 Tax=Fusobacterium sp. TaxID=68766 RepID=UPI002601FA10|nr:META domain-containing protein [uncultured Fusobacterium sp.]